MTHYKRLSYIITLGNQIQRLFFYVYTQTTKSANEIVHAITFVSEPSTVPFPPIMLSSSPIETIIDKETFNNIKKNGDYIIVKYTGEKSKDYSFRIGKRLTP